MDPTITPTINPMINLTQSNDESLPSTTPSSSISAITKDLIDMTNLNSSTSTNPTSSSNSITPNDCLSLFSSSISAQPNSIIQRSSLDKLKKSIESNPTFLPILYPSLLSLLSTHSNQVYYRKWISTIIELAICKSINLSNDQKLQITLQSTETLHRLINLQDPSDPQLLEIKKSSIQAFSSAYPILFKHACGCNKSNNSSDSKHWGLSNQIKGSILSIWRNEKSPLGLKLAAIKFVQRVIQVGTRGILDPRKRNDDPSIVMCGGINSNNNSSNHSLNSSNHHPYLKPKELEQEANNLLEESIKLLFQSKTPELVSAIIFSLGTLVRLRPNLSNLILSALTSYNPTSSPLITRSISVLQLKGIEKSLRITLSNLDRISSFSLYSNQIKDALLNQSKRIKDLNEKEREKKRQRKEIDSGTKKRQKADQLNSVESQNQEPTTQPMMISAHQLPGFDITSLPVELVTELMIANLQALSDQNLNNAINAYLSNLSNQANPKSLKLQSSLSSSSSQSQPLNSFSIPSSTEPPDIIRSGSPVRPTMELVSVSGLPLAITSEQPIEHINSIQFAQNNHQESQQEKELEDQDQIQDGQIIDDDDDDDDSVNNNDDSDNDEDYDYDDDDDDEDLILHSNLLTEDGEAESPQDKLTIFDAWQNDQPIQIYEPTRKVLLQTTIEQIISNGMIDNELKPDATIWSILLARLVTRGLESHGDVTIKELELRKEDIRQVLFNFIISDFPNRMPFARIWLTEEWLANPYQSKFDHDLNEISSYGRWLTNLLDYIIENLSSTNSNQPELLKMTLSHFLLDLPYIPERELIRLQELCQDPNKLTIGFTTLRDLTSMRPAIRNQTLDVLLGLTTHSRRQTRNAAIMSVKSWVLPTSGMKSLGDRVVSFAIQLLQRLELDDELEEEPILQSTNKLEEKHLTTEVEMEDGETTSLEAAEESSEPSVTFAKVENAVILSGLSKIKIENVVVQHLELLLALSVKNPDLLDHLFRAYPNMPNHVQESVGKLITPLVRSLGAKHSKIISLIQTCQSGSEPLVLRILSILTEKGKPPVAIIDAIKSLAAGSNDLSPRFIIPTIGDLTKTEIIHHLPRILTLLNGTIAEKNLIRSVFESIVQQPPSNFGSVSTNAPRLKQSELLTPVELLVLIHRTEDVPFNMKQAIEAIGICFSMTEIFKPEVLAAFMQQVVDELTLPTLFLRTVIQAVQTYKSLQAFVSTTLLSRLILKKIWTQPQLWEGFMRCAKIISPHSFGAILQLPRDQLRELVGKQGGLKGPLREYVNKKAGSNKSRVTSLLEILSDQAPEPSHSITSTPNPILNTPTGGSISNDLITETIIDKSNIHELSLPNLNQVASPPPTLSSINLNSDNQKDVIIEEKDDHLANQNSNDNDNETNNSDPSNSNNLLIPTPVG
ncbi:hypothetical protein O181_023321 [Austropuccinia psidii MF-1]|uniref:Symplekin n=1 Tax=Austropuccinia psidii MF-1 TaxID=1389203 RepID=A0A9Q3CJ60_9BASI|nr:hypothetical protein [Austropuccinia psidii MF-1]